VAGIYPKQPAASVRDRKKKLITRSYYAGCVAGYATSSRAKFPSQAQFKTVTAYKGGFIRKVQFQDELTITVTVVGFCAKGAPSVPPTCEICSLAASSSEPSAMLLKEAKFELQSGKCTLRVAFATPGRRVFVARIAADASDEATFADGCVLEVAEGTSNDSAKRGFRRTPEERKKLTQIETPLAKKYIPSEEQDERGDLEMTKSSTSATAKKN
jgi:hypothetical protein